MLIWVALLALTFALRAPFFWCCCGPCGEVCVAVKKTLCDGRTFPYENVYVTLDCGVGFTNSCTTGLDGRCCITIGAAGTCDIIVTPPPGSIYAAKTVSVSLTCTTNEVEVVLAKKAGASCTGCCDYPLPATLQLTNGLGLVTLTKQTGTGTTYLGCQYFPAAVAAVVLGCNDGPGRNGFVLGDTPGTSLLTHQLTCLSGEWSYAMGFYYSADYTHCFYDGGGARHFDTPGWRYQSKVDDGSGICTVGSPFFQIAVSTGDLTVDECDADGFQVSGTLPGTYTDPTFGLSVTNPAGTAVAITS